MIDIWPCNGCGRTWEIECELLPFKGPTALGFYKFDCPTPGCGQTTGMGPTLRPLKFREDNSIEWREV
jgi:hypothetical protein